MNQDERAELLRCCPDRAEPLLVVHEAVDVVVDHDTAQTELSDRAPQFGHGELGRLHRERAEAEEAAGMLPHELRDLVVAVGGDQGGDLGLAVVLVEDVGRRDELHVDAELVHLLDPALGQPAVLRVLELPVLGRHPVPGLAREHRLLEAPGSEVRVDVEDRVHRPRITCATRAVHS